MKQPLTERLVTNMKHVCPECHGMDDEMCDCEKCNGTGYVYDDETGKDEQEDK